MVRLDRKPSLPTVSKFPNPYFFGMFLHLLFLFHMNGPLGFKNLFLIGCNTDLYLHTKTGPTPCHLLASNVSNQTWHFPTHLLLASILTRSVHPHMSKFLLNRSGDHLLCYDRFTHSMPVYVFFFPVFRPIIPLPIF